MTPLGWEGEQDVILIHGEGVDVVDVEHYSKVTAHEVAAFPAALAFMPAGSVVFGLSTADRYDSWWALAAAHLERALEKAEEDDWKWLSTRTRADGGRSVLGYQAA